MTKLTTFNPTELKALLPPPAILATESATQFELVFEQLLTTLKVQDTLEAILIRDFAEANWEIRRYSRLRGLSFERAFRESLEFQVQRLKAREARKQQQIGAIAEHATLKPADIAQTTYQEQKVCETPSEVDEILSRTPSELDHAHALEKSVSFHQDVELVIASISRRRNEALRLLDLYRTGLGKRVDEAMKEIIDVEHEVVDVEHKVVDNKPKTVKEPLYVQNDDDGLWCKFVDGEIQEGVYRELSEGKFRRVR